MNDGLRVNLPPTCSGFQHKEPTWLNYLHSFVHERAESMLLCGPAPIGMLQGLLPRHRFEFRPFLSPKGPPMQSK